MSILAARTYRPKGVLFAEVADYAASSGYDQVGLSDGLAVVGAVVDVHDDMPLQQRLIRSARRTDEFLLDLRNILVLCAEDTSRHRVFLGLAQQQVDNFHHRIANGLEHICSLSAQPSEHTGMPGSLEVFLSLGSSLFGQIVVEPDQRPHIGKLALIKDKGGFDMAVGVGMLFGVGQFQPRRFNTQLAPDAFAGHVLKCDDIIRKSLETLVAVPAPDKSADEGGYNNKDNRYCKNVSFQYEYSSAYLLCIWRQQALLYNDGGSSCRSH